jgi:hypothetical protein
MLAKVEKEERISRRDYGLVLKHCILEINA